MWNVEQHIYEEDYNYSLSELIGFITAELKKLIKTNEYRNIPQTDISTALYRIGKVNDIPYIKVNKLLYIPNSYKEEFRNIQKQLKEIFKYVLPNGKFVIVNKYNDQIEKWVKMDIPYEYYLMENLKSVLENNGIYLLSVYIENLPIRAVNRGFKPKIEIRIIGEIDFEKDEQKFLNGVVKVKLIETDDEFYYEIVTNPIIKWLSILNNGIKVVYIDDEKFTRWYKDKWKYQEDYERQVETIMNRLLTDTQLLEKVKENLPNAAKQENFNKAYKIAIKNIAESIIKSSL